MRLRTMCLLFAMINSIAHAQRTVSLRQFEAIKNAYRNSPDPVAAGLDEGDDITYVKDVNNELNQFLGVWKGTYNNRSYELVFSKKVAYKYVSTDEISFDIIMGVITIKDSGGNIIYSNSHKPEASSNFTGSNFQGNTNIYTLNFTGNCYNESGTVFIDIKTNGKMSLSFSIAPDIQSNDCPNGFTPVLPVSPNHVILTKQP